MKYRVSWLRTTRCWAVVEAESKKEAIEKVKNGEGYTDTDPGNDILKSYAAEEDN